MQLSHRHSLELRLGVTVRIKFLALIAAGSHPFPSRTRQLSPPAPMIVGPQGPSKVGRRQINSKRKSPRFSRGLFCIAANDPRMTFVAAIVASMLFAAAPKPAPTENPDCLQYFHSACSEAIGAWLPDYSAFGSDFERRATHVSLRDGFVYEHEKVQPGQGLGFVGPDDGTFFVYGNAGPPKGHVVYDYAHRIAFFDQGCCAWHDVVEAYAPPPPKRVVDRDLTALRTVRGAYLGITESMVRSIYGNARSQAVPSHSGLTVLSYSTWTLDKNGSFVPNRHGQFQDYCGQSQDFYFRGGRLAIIQIGNAC